MKIHGRSTQKQISRGGAGKDRRSVDERRLKGERGEIGEQDDPVTRTEDL